MRYRALALYQGGVLRPPLGDIFSVYGSPRGVKRLWGPWGAPEEPQQICFLIPQVSALLQMVAAPREIELQRSLIDFA